MLRQSDSSIIRFIPSCFEKYLYVYEHGLKWAGGKWRRKQKRQSQNGENRLHTHILRLIVVEKHDKRNYIGFGIHQSQTDTDTNKNKNEAQTKSNSEHSTK